MSWENRTVAHPKTTLVQKHFLFQFM